MCLNAQCAMWLVACGLFGVMGGQVRGGEGGGLVVVWRMSNMVGTMGG